MVCESGKKSGDGPDRSATSVHTPGTPYNPPEPTETLRSHITPVHWHFSEIAKIAPSRPPQGTTPSRRAPARSACARSSVRTAQPDMQMSHARTPTMSTGVCKSRFFALRGGIAKSPTLLPPHASKRVAPPPAAAPALVPGRVGHGPMSVGRNPVHTRRVRACAKRKNQQVGDVSGGRSKIFIFEMKPRIARADPGGSRAKCRAAYRVQKVHGAAEPRWLPAPRRAMPEVTS